jgi:hypothetical protein
MKQPIPTIAVGALLALELVGVAGAGPMEDGQAAFDRKDFATALQQWRPVAGKSEARICTLRLITSDTQCASHGGSVHGYDCALCEIMTSWIEPPALFLPANAAT